jgi:hypothetical protein
VLVAVLASDRDSLDALDFEWDYKFIGPLNKVLTELGINSKEELLKFYGKGPHEWCPFGDQVNIITVLDNLKNAVWKATKEKVEIEWKLIGPDFWSNNLKAAEAEAARLVKDLSLVVIDPISLVDQNVAAAFELIEGSFLNTNSAVMVLTPYKMFEPSASLRRLVEVRARSFATLFYQPPVPPTSPFANFGTGVSDVIDMQRLMLLTLGQYIGTQKGLNNWTNMS